MTTSANSCFATLRHDILNGRYSPGDRLPPERTLAQQMGVGRVTMRSALTRLASANLLRVRQGSGYVVQDYRRSGGPDLLRDVVEIAEKSGAFVDVARDLLHVRRHLACAVFERLKDRPLSVDDRTRFTLAVDAFEAAIDEDLCLLLERDLDILSVLLDATGSPVLGLCINPISSVLKALPQLAGAMYAAPSENALAWRALSTALQEGIPLEVGTWMELLRERDEKTLESIRQLKSE